jgi:hypothetical protein
MRYQASLIAVLALALLSACGSEPATPASEAPRPTPTPLVRTTEQIDPADVINAPTTEPGETLYANEGSEKVTLKCDKYNRVMINGSENEVTITGVCSQITINGKMNRVVATAAAEIIAYGPENTVQYSKYANGKKPVITDTSKTNTITKVAATDANSAKPANSNAK